MGDMDVGGVEVGGSVAECALAALLDEGVTVDVRPFLDEVIANPDDLERGAWPPAKGEFNLPN